MESNQTPCAKYSSNELEVAHFVQGVYLQVPLMTWHFPLHFQSHPTEQIAEAHSKSYVVIHGSAVPL